MTETPASTAEKSATSISALQEKERPTTPLAPDKHETAVVTERFSSTRLEFIDGLRGVAILMVVLRHYYMGIYDMGLPRTADILSLGYLGVHLFLLLSGFCIAWAFVGPKPRDMSLKEFASRRATRILPAYYLAFVIFLLLYPPTSGLLWQVFTHVTMTHNLFPETTLAINGVFWSLALESQLYVTFPLMLTAFRKIGPLRALAIVFLLQMSYRLLVQRNLGDYALFTYGYGVFGRMAEFALGIWAAMLVSGSAKKPFSSLSRFAFPLLTLLFFGLAMVLKRKLGTYSPWTDVAWTLMFFSLLLSGSVENSITSRLLSFRPLVGLGVISYSVYLMHNLPLSWFTRWRHQLPFTGIQMLTLGVVPVLTGVIAFCWLYYRFIEKPSIDYFARRRKKSTVAAIQTSAKHPA